jgi:hypothetical protein
MIGERTRLTKMHAKALTCFNFFNFHPVSTKFPINIEHVILTNRMFFASTDFQSVAAMSGPEVGICREKHT